MSDKRLTSLQTRLGHVLKIDHLKRLNHILVRREHLFNTSGHSCPTL